MSGGGSDNPDFFNDEIFNFRRIRLAPTIVIIGFGVAVLSIFNNQIVKMSNLEAIILGLIQGLTEFLPISSSGHLEIGKALFGNNHEEMKAYY